MTAQEKHGQNFARPLSASKKLRRLGGRNRCVTRVLMVAMPVPLC